MASTTWRLCGLDVAPGLLSVALSAIRLWDAAGRVEGQASLTSGIAPAAGSLGNLIDGSAATVSEWTAASIKAAGFYVQFEFPAPVELRALEVDTVVPGALSNAVLLQLVNGQWQLSLTNWFAPDEPVAMGAPTAYQAAVLADSPSVFLACNELTGDALDSVAGVAFAVRPDALRVPQVNKLVKGGSAFGMPLVSDITPLICAKDSGPGANTGDYTIEHVLQGGLLPGVTQHNLLSREVGGQLWPEYELMQMGSSSMILRVRVSNSDSPRAVDQAVAAFVLDGKRHHLALTKAGLRYRVYVDGVVVIDATATQTPLSGTSGRLAICGRYTTAGLANQYAGSVFGVALYERALSDAQITSHVAVLGTLPVRTLSQRQHTVLQIRGEATPAQGLQSMVRHRASKLIDVECGGQGRIYGTVSRKETPANMPLRRRVRLHRSVDGYLARETWSKADGSYEFREISTRYEWDVIAWDQELQEYSTVANNQLAEVA